MKESNYLLSFFKDLQYQNLLSDSFQSLYESFKNDQLAIILSSLHKKMLESFRELNKRLSQNERGGYFRAEDSRNLMHILELTFELCDKLKGTEYSFIIEKDYDDFIKNLKPSLARSGSVLPASLKKIELYYTIPIFQRDNFLQIGRGAKKFHYSLKLIGEGSYAKVFRFKDTFYDKFFVLKRANSDLNDKEILRFKREFEEMKKLSSPYILEVYKFDSENNHYIMEHMDFTLYDFIKKNNSTLLLSLRKNIVMQMLRGVGYLHSISILHRDLSPKNVLIKKYDDTTIVKISDFGLVKVENSQLTSMATDFKGYYNDPSLVVDGFDSYSIHHEIYAVTRLIFFIMTGKDQVTKHSNENFNKLVSKGMSTDKEERFKNIDQLLAAYKAIF